METKFTEVKTEQDINNIHAYTKSGSAYFNNRKPEISAAVPGGKVYVKIKDIIPGIDGLETQLFNKPLQNNHNCATGDDSGCEP